MTINVTIVTINLPVNNCDNKYLGFAQNGEKNSVGLPLLEQGHFLCQHSCTHRSRGLRGSVCQAFSGIMWSLTTDNQRLRWSMAMTLFWEAPDGKSWNFQGSSNT
jgi:hypothetical protein